MVYKEYQNNKLWINVSSEMLSKLSYYKKAFGMSRNKLIVTLLKTSLNSFPDLHSLDIEFDEDLQIFKNNNQKGGQKNNGRKK